MTTEAVKEERTDRSVALIGTLLFHAAILALLYLCYIISPIPPYPPPKNTPEVEVALDFGNNTNGTGNVEAPNIGDNPQTDNTQEQSEAKPTPQADAIVTNEAEETPPVVSAKKPSKVDKVDTVTPKPAPPTLSVDLAAAENKFKHSKGAPGGNGNSGNAGNAGSPDGKTPGVGNGNGGPFQFFLKDRRPLNHPFISDNSQDQGKVVVDIIVDESGTVIKATPGAKGTTINTPYLYAKAKQAALETKFSKSPDGTPEQEGTITIEFGIQ